jgi:lambda family phage tail tape measure protein
MMSSPLLQAGERESLEQLRSTTLNLIDMLVSEGVLSKSKADILKKDAEAARLASVEKEALEKAEKQAEMLKVAKLISDEYNRQQVYSVQQLAIRNQMLGMTQDERRVQEAINQVTSETSRMIDEITKKKEDAAGRDGDPEVIAEYDIQIAKVIELEQVYIQMARTVEETSIATQRTFAFGWDTAFNQFTENAYNYATLAQDIFSTLTSNMNQAINTFVQTGKFAFKDFATSVIQDLLAIELRMQASQLLSMGIKAFMGSFGGSAGPELWKRYERSGPARQTKGCAASSSAPASEARCARCATAAAARFRRLGRKSTF